MTQQTSVERAAGLFDAAQSSGHSIYTPADEAERLVRNVLILENITEPNATELSKAGRLLSLARRQGRVG